MIKVQDKLAKSVECLEYFTTHQWKFHSDNVFSLLDALQEKDRQQFQFDVRTIQWEDYVEKYVLGFRQFLFKQSPSSLEDSRKRMKKCVRKFISGENHFSFFSNISISILD